MTNNEYKSVRERLFSDLCDFLHHRKLDDSLVAALANADLKEEYEEKDATYSEEWR